MARAVLVVCEKDVEPPLRDRTLANFTELFRLLDRTQRAATRKKANDITTRNLKLDTDPMTPVEDFEALTKALAEIVYRPVLDVQRMPKS